MSKRVKTVLIIIILLLIANAGVIFYLVFKNKGYTITFNSNGGSEVTNVTVKRGEKVLKPTEPTKEGYTFANWYIGTDMYDFNTKVTKDITLNAMWTSNDIIEKYIVTFDSDGGSNIASQNVDVNTNLSIPIPPTKEGYTFVEWQLDSKTYDFTVPVTSNITLKATWVKSSEEKEYTIIFFTDGGSAIINQKVVANGVITKPTDPQKERYAFVEWQLDNKTYDFKTKVTKDLTLTAKWQIIDTNTKYTITFDSDGGSTVKNQSVSNGTKLSKPTNPTRSGYTFVEWQLDSKTYDFNTIVTGNITLKAIWKENAKTYAVSFNSNGGSSVKTQNIVEGAKATKPTNPTKSGYTFVEWQLNGLIYDFNTKIKNDIALVAKWQKNIAKYTITFNSDEGSIVGNQIIEEGFKATKPTNPIKEGYTFVEWQLNGTTYNFNTIVTNNLTLTAKWQSNN